MLERQPSSPCPPSSLVASPSSDLRASRYAITAELERGGAGRSANRDGRHALLSSIEEVDRPVLAPLATRLESAHEHLKIQLNPKNGSLHLRGLLQAQAAAEATKSAELALHSLLLSMLRSHREQAAADAESLREQLAASEHRIRHLKREHEKECDTLKDDAARRVASVKADLADALARIRALEEEAKEDAAAYAKSLESHQRHAEAVRKNLENQILRERAEADEASQRMAHQHAGRVENLIAEGEARLRMLCGELPGLEEVPERLMAEIRRLEGERDNGQLAVRVLRTELRLVHSVLASEIERLQGMIRDAFRPDSPPNAWRKLQRQALKREPPSALYEHTLKALEFLREQEGGEEEDHTLGMVAAAIRPASVMAVAPRSPPPPPRPVSGSPSARASRAAAAAAANHAAAVAQATMEAGPVPSDRWWQAHSPGQRIGGTKAWRERQLMAQLELGPSTFF